MHWIHHVQDRIQWRDLVNMVVNINGEEFLNHLSDCQRLKKDFAPWSSLDYRFWTYEGCYIDAKYSAPRSRLL
jgi:hypothetical protein